MSQNKAMRLELPPDETMKLEQLQQALKHNLGMTYVSKAAAVRFLIRNFQFPITDQTTDL